MQNKKRMLNEADFQKNVFLVEQMDFSSSPKALKRRCFGQVFCSAGKFFKKTGKKKLENFDKN